MRDARSSVEISCFLGDDQVFVGNRADGRPAAYRADIAVPKHVTAVKKAEQAAIQVRHVLGHALGQGEVEVRLKVTRQGVVIDTTARKFLHLGGASGGEHFPARLRLCLDNRLQQSCVAHTTDVALLSLGVGTLVDLQAQEVQAFGVVRYPALARGQVRVHTVQNVRGDLAQGRVKFYAFGEVLIEVLVARRFLWFFLGYCDASVVSHAYDRRAYRCFLRLGKHTRPRIGRLLLRRRLGDRVVVPCSQEVGGVQRRHDYAGGGGAP